MKGRENVMMDAVIDGQYIQVDGSMNGRIN
jgi:hypothetical protein